MTTTLAIGDHFPDATLLNHRTTPRRLSSYTRPSPLDLHMGFTDGYPLIVVFGRGFFCPRDQQQFRQLVQLQEELAVNYCKLVTISADLPLVQAAFRAGLGASWPFLSDEGRELIMQINILDDTEGEYAYRAQPYTFVLQPDLTIHTIYNGWWYVGRPTLEELRHDLRAIMATRKDYSWEAYATDAARQIRIPQQAWLHGAPALGASGLPVATGVISTFDVAAGHGTILRDDVSDQIFFSFTAIPGEGYRTIAPGTRVAFELVDNPTGLTARNIQKQENAQ